MTVEIINGSRTSFGPRDVNVNLGHEVHVAGVEHQLVLKLKAGDMPQHTAYDATGAFIPAGSTITQMVVLPSTVTFATGVSIDVALEKLDGTAHGDTPVEATILTATLNAGTVFNFADLDNTSVTTDDAYVSITENTSYTAGEGVVVIKYIPSIV